jgi:two-component system, OmpR family, response regulator
VYACASTNVEDAFFMPTDKPRSYRIAVVEDDHHLRHDLIDFLQWKGFDAIGCEGADAFEAVHQRRPIDLVLLDLGLVGRSGLALLEQLNAQTNRPGVVVLTAFGTDDNRIHGLQQGADAYLVKGVSLELIEATCHSVLRRLVPAPNGAQSVAASEPLGLWRLDLLRSELVAPLGQAIALTHMEFEFLQAVMKAPGQAVQRDAILALLGKPNNPNNVRNLDNCATRLRRKVLQETGQELPVRARYGLGYVFSEKAAMGLPPAT